jgi:hypothetical protein
MFFTAKRLQDSAQGYQIEASSAESASDIMVLFAGTTRGLDQRSSFFYAFSRTTAVLESTAPSALDDIGNPFLGLNPACASRLNSETAFNLQASSLGSPSR